MSDPRYPYALPAGTNIAGYEIVRVLGVGGFGITYEGYNEIARRRVAIKEFYPQGIASREGATKVLFPSGENELIRWALARFKSSTTELAQIQHPGIVDVINYIADNNTGYMIMAHVDGKSVSDMVRSRDEPLSAEELMTLMKPVCDAMEFVHKRGIIHRDIAPDNIMVRSDGRPVLIDFGALKVIEDRTAARHHASQTFGVTKRYYSAPELYDEDVKPDARADVYSLGAVAYFALTGKPPASGDDRLRAKGYDKPDPYLPVANVLQGIPANVAEAVDRALSVRAEKRFEGVAEFLQALAEVKDNLDETLIAKHDRPQQTETNNSERNAEPHSKVSAVGVPRVLLFAISLVAAVIIGGAIVFGILQYAGTSRVAAPQLPPVSVPGPPQSTPTSPPPSAPQKPDRPAAVQTKWNLPSAFPSNNPHVENLTQFAKDVELNTKGNLVITLYPSSQLYRAPEIKRAIQTGQSEIGEVLISLLESEDPVFGIDVVPFLATSFADAKRLYLASKPTMQTKLASQGLMLLYAMPWPPPGIFAKKGIYSVADLKGLKWRAYNVGTTRIAEIAGAAVAVVPQAELFQAVAVGLIDAFMTSSSTGIDTKVWELPITHFHDVRAWFPKNMVIVNKAAFDKLDPETKAALLEAAAVAEERGWRVAEEKVSGYLRTLTANKIQVIQPSARLKADFDEIGQILAAEWQKRAGDLGTEILNAYRRK